MQYWRVDTPPLPFFFLFSGFHILPLHLKTDGNSVWGSLALLVLGFLDWLVHPLKLQLSPPGSGPLPFFPAPWGCKLQGPRGRVDHINCAAGQVDGAAQPEREMGAAFIHFLTDQLTFPEIARHLGVYKNVPNL